MEGKNYGMPFLKVMCSELNLEESGLFPVKTEIRINRGFVLCLKYKYLKENISEWRAMARQGVKIQQSTYFQADFDEHDHLLFMIGLVLLPLSAIPILSTFLKFGVGHTRKYSRVTSSFVFRNSSWQSFGDHRGCQGLNINWLCAR